MIRYISLGLLAILLAGCGGREANPVATIEARDQYSNCDQIRQEIAINQQKARQLLATSDSTKTRNWIVGAGGVLLFPPALFALDLKDGERTEANALEARNKYLLGLAARRCPPGQPLS